MSPRDEEVAVSAQQFGAMQATLDITVRVLEKHLKDCYEQNAVVARSVRNLTVAVAVLAFVVLGEEKVLAVIEKFFT